MQGIRAAQDDAEKALRQIASFSLKIPQPPENIKVIFAPLPRIDPTLDDLEVFMALHCITEPHRALLRVIFRAEKAAIDSEIIAPALPGHVFTVEATENTLHLHDGTAIEATRGQFVSFFQRRNFGTAED